MKFNHSASVAQNNGNFSRAIVLTLACSSLLSGELGFSWLNPPAAFGAGELDRMALLSKTPLPKTEKIASESAQAILQDASDRSGYPISQLNIIYHFTSTDVFLDPKVAATTKPPLPDAQRQMVLRDAAQRSGLPNSRLKITRSRAVTFGNLCMFNFGEICTKEYTPIKGWEIVVQVGAESWTYHLSQSGSRLMLDPTITTKNVRKLPATIRNAVMQDVMQWMQLTEPTVKIVDAQKRTWGNDCEFIFGNICPAIYQPVDGWEVTMQSQQLRWVYHVKQDASTVLMDRRAVIPSVVVNAVVKDLTSQNPSGLTLNKLRFIEARQQGTTVCPRPRQCRNAIVWLVVVSDGRTQWGYRVDNAGSQAVQIPLLQALQIQD
jgi:hypothetical protein